MPNDSAGRYGPADEERHQQGGHQDGGYQQGGYQQGGYQQGGYPGRDYAGHDYEGHEFTGRDYQGYPTGEYQYATSDLYDTNGHGGRWPDNWAQGADEVDEEEEDEAAIKRDYWTVLLWTLAWFAVPMIILVGRALLLSSEPEAVCTAAGLGGCTSPRADALSDLISNAPIWCFAMVAALTLALVLRWASDSWRGATIGFCAAVVSGGAITVLSRIL